MFRRPIPMFTRPISLFNLGRSGCSRWTVTRNLGDQPPRPVPGGGQVLEAPVANQRSVARPAAGPREQVLDGPLQDLVGRKPGGVGHAALLQRLVEGWDGKGRVGSDDDGLLPDLGPLNDRITLSTTSVKSANVRCLLA